MFQLVEEFLKQENIVLKKRDKSSLISSAPDMSLLVCFAVLSNLYFNDWKLACGKV